ncbi:MAG TPA: flagellar hook capping FlgD N-terminal domain-containing protein, partial [Mobilitalea sp.]|nr:flagellar hook capping FlgD N-terminal domain-containing protein [Mobilitalea sp.]
MSELIQPVKNGVIEQTKSSSTKEATAKNTLGKDAFLQLLVAQMKYQDPLNPASNTEYIAQLATFSQLEQMQNLNAMASNSQALSLVGKNVIVKTKSDTGNINYVSGRVDFVNISNNKARISINGKLYSIEDIDSVIDDTYILEQGRPRIDKKAELEYDAKNPSDIIFEVYQGDGEAKADEVAV